MSIISIGGEKGGCGKTTLATNLAAYLAGQGHSVGLLDADPKPTAARWAERRKERGVPQIVCKRAIGDIDAVIKAMGQEYDYTIIDCGGHDSKELRYAVAYGDLFIAPFMPSIYDTETATLIDSLIERSRVLNPNLKACSVLVAASTVRNSITNKDTLASLGAMRHIKPLDAAVHQLDEYRHTAMHGLGVAEGKSARAKIDIHRVWEELCQSL